GSELGSTVPRDREDTTGHIRRKERVLVMKWFNIFRDRIRALRQREHVINDIDREMRLHLEMQVDANIKAGMSPAEAREKAMRSFGNLNRAVDAAYDVKG